jgi:predicted O-linked N-acetylglucosamine transferase (SPINDLY family)
MGTQRRRAAVPFSSSPCRRRLETSFDARVYAADKIRLRDPLWAASAMATTIRVAYLSADFHDHATPISPPQLFERHDRRRFEVTAVSFRPDSRTPCAPGCGAFDRFLDVAGAATSEVSRLLRSLEIDIAVDLTGSRTRGREFSLAVRPGAV